MRKKITISGLLSKKGSERIACLTAYDYTSALILDQAGMDLILVGDSLGMVIQGNESTLKVTLEEMIYHGRLVKRGVTAAFLVVDMPFGTYNSVSQGIDSAVRLIKATGADAVKLEGATSDILEIVSRLTTLGVNVMGHIGLMPQHVGVMGGYRIQGYENGDALLKQALELEAAGAKLIVLEGIEADCSRQITEQLKIPTIGIGAGKHCDGQVLVYHDVFGLYREMQPKFVKRFAEAGELIESAACEYIKEVKEQVFPADVNSYIRKNGDKK